MPFLNEASQNPILRQLFPYTSMSDFCFSRCTGFPYSRDCPFVRPLGNILDQVFGYKYEVFDYKNEPIGKGNASRAVELVVSHLPFNSGIATKGTADDLEKAIFK